MSGTVNKAILIGHLGAAPEIRRTQDGRPVASFNLATNENWRDKASGERKQVTDWHRVVVFNDQLVKIAEQYLKKGSKVYVAGQMKTRKWTDQAGAERYTTEVVLGAYRAELTLLDRADRAPGATGLDDYGTSSDPAPAAARPSHRDEMNDEIPF